MRNEDILGYIMIGLVVFASYYIYQENYESFQLKCIVSDVDGNKYCVRDRKEVEKAADLLARVTVKCKELVVYTSDKYPDKENVKRLKKNFNPTKIMETLPTSSYTAYSENKGEKVAFCLNKEKQDNDNLIDEYLVPYVEK